MKKLSSNTESINTFINNREIWKSLQSQIDEVNKTLNTLKEIKTPTDTDFVPNTPKFVKREALLMTIVFVFVFVSFLIPHVD